MCQPSKYYDLGSYIRSDVQSDLESKLHDDSNSKDAKILKDGENEKVAYEV